MDKKEKEKILAETKKINLKNSQKIAEETTKAQADGKKILMVECCENCLAHSYCTHHDEKKYQDFFARLKSEVEAQDRRVFVTKNFNIAKPVIGAFTVKYEDVVLFSKHKAKAWPCVEQLSKEIIATIAKDDAPKENNPQKAKS